MATAAVSVEAASIELKLAAGHRLTDYEYRCIIDNPRAPAWVVEALLESGDLRKTYHGYTGDSRSTDWYGLYAHPACPREHLVEACREAHGGSKPHGWGAVNNQNITANAAAELLAIVETYANGRGMPLGVLQARHAEILAKYQDDQYGYERSKEFVEAIITGRRHWPAELIEWLATLKPVRRGKGLRRTMFTAMSHSEVVPVTPFVTRLIYENGDEAARQINKHPCKEFVRAIEAQMDNVEALRHRLNTATNRREYRRLVTAIYELVCNDKNNAAARNVLERDAPWHDLCDESDLETMVKQYGMKDCRGVAINPRAGLFVLDAMDLSQGPVGAAIADRATRDKAWMGKSDVLAPWGPGILEFLLRRFNGDYSSDGAQALLGALAVVAKKHGHRLLVSVEKSTPGGVVLKGSQGTTTASATSNALEGDEA